METAKGFQEFSEILEGSTTYYESSEPECEESFENSLARSEHVRKIDFSSISMRSLIQLRRKKGSFAKGTFISKIIVNPDIRVVRYALEHGLDPNKFGKDKSDPLITLIEDRLFDYGTVNPEYIELLANFGLPIDKEYTYSFDYGFQDEEGITPLMLCVIHEDYKAAKKLIELGADITHRTKTSGCTVLFMTVCKTFYTPDKLKNTISLVLEHLPKPLWSQVLANGDDIYITFAKFFNELVLPPDNAYYYIKTLLENRVPMVTDPTGRMLIEILQPKIAVAEVSEGIQGGTPFLQMMILCGYSSFDRSLIPDHLKPTSQKFIEFFGTSDVNGLRLDRPTSLNILTICILNGIVDTSTPYVPYLDVSMPREKSFAKILLNRCRPRAEGFFPLRRYVLFQSRKKQISLNGVPDCVKLPKP